ncbi:MAG: ROK family protein [Bradyrhizobium sp.]|uniref:ROK family protein n=1 Tax=Bradyrhizobium sp. TaxID=376 RepID=UPI001C2894E5|nr:ROK family protein [Bradyrhizobium sp.]MBU6463006.1 ROK family protein [Pseudomonadota bacterium]MDE2066755.1 ROK family protein [Bradyrhizobium sp.]MDE2243406.1 ROK family protein [Bradyrhizobium sp.]MDE2467814.1 ROK family protein [Bradyrhizobium sp.]
MKNGSAPGTILSIDVGGSHVKVMTSKNRIKREFVSGPKLTAKSMVAQIKEITKDWSYDVISVGYPGPVVRDCPAAEPHNLGKGWKGFDFGRAFGRPVKVVNDALMQALGDYENGKMLFLGLGTGLGSAMIVDGALVPMELAHLPYRKDKTFEDFVGAAGLKRHGKKKWTGYVEDVVDRLVAALEPDYVVIGGGNADKLGVLPKKSRIGKNGNAFLGGFRLWQDAALHRVHR